MTSKPYESGYLAFWDGHQPSYCPFIVGTAEHREWINGYEVANNEILTAPDTVPLDQCMIHLWRTGHDIGEAGA